MAKPNKPAASAPASIETVLDAYDKTYCGGMGAASRIFLRRFLEWHLATSTGLEDELEEIIGNGPSKEPPDGPTVGYSRHGYRSGDPDAPDDTVPDEAFAEGVARGWWEAAQIAEKALSRRRSMADKDHDGKALRLAISALGRISVLCMDRPASPLKRYGDVAREALTDIMAEVGTHRYDELTAS